MRDSVLEQAAHGSGLTFNGLRQGVVAFTRGRLAPLCHARLDPSRALDLKWRRGLASNQRLVRPCTWSAAPSPVLILGFRKFKGSRF